MWCSALTTPESHGYDISNTRASASTLYITLFQWSHEMQHVSSSNYLAISWQTDSIECSDAELPRSTFTYYQHHVTWARLKIDDIENHGALTLAGKRESDHWILRWGGDTEWISTRIFHLGRTTLWMEGASARMMVTMEEQHYKGISGYPYGYFNLASGTQQFRSRVTMLWGEMKDLMTLLGGCPHWGWEYPAGNILRLCSRTRQPIILRLLHVGILLRLAVIERNISESKTTALCDILIIKNSYDQTHQMLKNQGADCGMLATPCLTNIYDIVDDTRGAACTRWSAMGDNNEPFGNRHSLK